VTSNHIFKEKKKGKSEKKNEQCCCGWKREVEVQEQGMVNKHIFWRSAGGNALEGRDMNS
jgi:hypothetical protein